MKRSSLKKIRRQKKIKTFNYVYDGHMKHEAYTKKKPLISDQGLRKCNKLLALLFGKLIVSYC